MSVGGAGRASSWVAHHPGFLLPAPLFSKPTVSTVARIESRRGGPASHSTADSLSRSKLLCPGPVPIPYPIPPRLSGGILVLLALP